MKRFFAIFLSALPLLLTSCQDTLVDSLIELTKEIDELRIQDKILMERVEVYNESVEALKAIIDVLETGDYIEKVVPLWDEAGEKIVGYTIFFTSAERDPITLNYGVDGVDGYIPSISASLAGDGEYYWTLDGEWILDENGEKISVINGMCPRISVIDGYWYVSYDLGTTWAQLGKATGEDGRDGIDARPPVTIPDGGNTADGVSFLLPDGTGFYIQKRRNIELVLDLNGRETGISADETVTIPYVIKNADENTSLSVSTDGNFTVDFTHEALNSNNEIKGVINITRQGAYVDGFVNIMVFTSSGVAAMEIVSFYEKHMTVSSEFLASAGGGKLDIPFEANFDYRVEVDPSAASWLSILSTRAHETVKGNISVQVAKNSGITRSGIVYVYPDNSSMPFASIFITQNSAYCTIDKASFVVEAEGGNISSSVTSSYGMSVTVPESARGWLSAEVNFGEEKDNYSVLISVEPNSGARRSANLSLYSTDGSKLLATLLVVQAKRNTDVEKSMSIIVRANYSNDFTVYLPIDLNPSYPVDCYVDWGDGKGERVTTNQQSWNAGVNTVSHRYEGLTVGQTFEVIITGKVTSLSSSRIPKGNVSAIEAIKRWGNLGLTNMDGALSGLTELKTLPLDEVGAFSEVTSFYESFYGCTGLTDVSEHLFDYANIATSFKSAFKNCSGLRSIGSKLFSKCISARDFEMTFSGCRSLQRIPEGLFDACVSAKNFVETFYSCTSLNSIPESLFSKTTEAENFTSCFGKNSMLNAIPANLFANCKNAGYFSGVFQGCSSLKRIPSDIFKNNIRIIGVGAAFDGCKSVTGESPYNIVDGKKVHLYERQNYPDNFFLIKGFGGCFGDCLYLSDRNNIPTSWK